MQRRPGHVGPSLARASPGCHRSPVDEAVDEAVNATVDDAAADDAGVGDVAAARGPLAVESRLEEADVRAGLFLTLTRQGNGLRWLPVSYVLAALALAGTLAFAAVATLPTPVWGFAFVLAAFLVFVPGSIVRIAKRAYAALPTPVAEWVLDDRGVRITSGPHRTELSWETMYAVNETHRAFYLHPRAGLFHVLPKRTLSPAAHTSIRALIARHGRPPHRAAEWVAWASPSLLLVLGALALLLIRVAMK